MAKGRRICNQLDYANKYSKSEISVYAIYTCFGYKTKTGVVRILVIFQDRPMFSLIIRKVSARAFY